MEKRTELILMAGDSLGEEALEKCWHHCAALATALGRPVLLATMNEARLPVSEFVFPPGLVGHGEIVPPGAVVHTGHVHA
jgi:hypothetical protein